jgi:PAS domain S-box-containing protein
VVFAPPSVVAALDIPAAVLDAGGRIVAANDAWRRVRDLPGEPGEPLPPAPPSPWDAAAVAEAVGTAAGGAAAEVVCSLRDGSRARLRFAPLASLGSAQYALVTLGSDLGEAPASTQAFGDEQWFRALVAALDEGFTLQDATGEILAYNPAAERMLGLSRDETTGRTIADPRWRAIRLDGAPLPGDQHPAILSLRTGRACSDVLMGVDRPDGEPSWISVNSRPLSRTGEDRPYAVVSSFTDITERRRSAIEARRNERRLAALVAGLPSGILVEGSDRTVALANEELCRLFGLTASPEQLVGTDSRAAIGSLAALVDDPAGFLAGVEALLAAGADVRGDELPLRDGRALERDFMTVDLGPGGRETLWVYRDITAHKHAEQEIAEARDQALATSRAKSEFLATLSHEVRTPMSGIVGMVDLLLSLPLDRDVREVVEGVRLSADALTSMLNDMVDLARIEVGRLQLDEVPFDLRALLDGVAETLGSRARQKSLPMVVQVAPDTPACLLGDDARLRQVLLNLVGNAVKFTDTGEIVVSAGPRTGGPGGRDGRHLVIDVVDTGPGIAPEAMARVFDPFVQEDASIARRHGGSGLGLAITARLVRLMGGRVEVDSAPSLGSRFRVDVPLRLPEPGEVPNRSGAGKARAVEARAVEARAVEARAVEAGAVEAGDAGDGTPAHRMGRLVGRRMLLAAPGAPRSAAALTAILRAEGAIVAEVTGDLPTAVRAARQAGQAVDAVLWLDDARDAGVRARVAGLAQAVHPGAPVLLLSRTDPPRGHPSGVAVLALPVRPDQLIDAVRGTVAAVPERPAAVQPLPGGRVLLAEDNDVNRAIIGRMLELLGMTRDEVRDGAAAVEAALAGHYDVILMDIQMPGTDGVEATRRIRAAEQDRHTPIIALTANAMGGDRETYLAAGMDDYLAKPMRLTALRALLERCLARPPAAAGPDLDESRLTELREHLQDVALVVSTVELFLAELPGRCTAVTEAGERLDRVALRTAAHTLKSTSALLGAAAVAGLCERLETTADDGDPADLRALAATMVPTAARAEVAMRRYLAHI